MFELEKHRDEFFYLFEDCRPVKGAKRSGICDLSKKVVHFIPTEYFELVVEFRRKRLRDLQEMVDSRNVPNLFTFLQFLLDNNLGMFVEDISRFPEVTMEWDSASSITNAIIDVRNEIHDFENIFSQLTTLNCKDVQIRCFEYLSLSDVNTFLQYAQDTSIKSIDLLLKYSAEQSMQLVQQLITDHKLITFVTIHSAPYNKLIEPDWISTGMTNGKIFYTTQVIDSQEHCGIINLKNFSIPEIDGFIENKLYNGCLNRKISIDSSGQIRNCPSLPDSYGHIKDTPLKSVLTNELFTAKWLINKDQINVCKDCEFRYICTDCRAYLADSGDPYSKPGKCKYNPYEAIWDQ